MSPEKHPYDYYYRPGMPLRPPPPRVAPSSLWTSPRRVLLSSWMRVDEQPADTPVARLFADHLWQGDELMDDIVKLFRTIGARKGRSLLDSALDQGIDSIEGPPAELVNLFRQLDNPPAWCDPAKWERGRRLWINSSLAGKFAMLVQDGMGTFVGEEVSLATGATKRFTASPTRRTLETLVFFRNVTYPNAVDRSSAAFKDIVKVRLMHAQARAGLRRSWGDGHFAHHGNPVSAATSMGAAATFGLIPLLTDHAHGRPCTLEELDDCVTYWSYIAYLMGVDEPLIPKTATEALQMIDYMVGTAGGPTQGTSTMAGAYTRGLEGGGLRARVRRAIATPLVGLLASYSGEPLVRALFAQTPLGRAPIEPWRTLAGLAVQANVGARRIADDLPLADARMRLRARDGDPSSRVQTAVFAWLAARQNVIGTPYNHHDATPETSPGAAVA